MNLEPLNRYVKKARNIAENNGSRLVQRINGGNIMTTNKTKRLGCYVRVSHDEQVKHGFSIEAQKDALQQWADDNGHKIIGWFIDEGVSARKKVKNRPQLQKMLRAVENGEIDLIIFIKLDRYFRSVGEYHNTQRILDENKTDWKAITEDYDTTTSDGRFKINMMLSFAEQEADRTSDRIKFTFEHKVKNKQPISGTQPCGYKVGLNPDGTKCVIKDETAADAVQAVFKHFMTYHSVSGATTYMNHEYGYKINYYTIKKMMSNTYYYGHYRGVDDYCPAYITKDEFDKIQEILKNRNTKTPKTRRVYIFTGLLQCPECKGRLTSSFTNKGGKDYQNYRCDKCHKQKHCSFNRMFSELKLEKWLLKIIRPELEKYIAEIEVKAEKVVPAGNRAEIQAEMERLNYLFKKNRIGIDEYDRDYDALEAKLNALDEATKSVDVSHVKQFLESDILDLYNTLSREDKRAAWRMIIDKIIMDKNGNHTVIFL